jgi:hypothetical protein
MHPPYYFVFFVFFKMTQTFRKLFYVAPCTTLSQVTTTATFKNEAFPNRHIPKVNEPELQNECFSVSGISTRKQQLRAPLSRRRFLFFTNHHQPPDPLRILFWPV